MVFYSQYPRGSYPQRNRWEGQNSNQYRNEPYMYGPPRWRDYPPQMNGRGMQNRYYEAPPFLQSDRGIAQRTPFPEENYRQERGMDHLMGHVNNISNGLNMISQLGAVMKTFRGL